MSQFKTAVIVLIAAVLASSPERAAACDRAAISKRLPAIMKLYFEAEDALQSSSMLRYNSAVRGLSSVLRRFDAGTATDARGGCEFALQNVLSGLRSLEEARSLAEARVKIPGLKHALSSWAYFAGRKDVKRRKFASQ